MDQENKSKIKNKSENDTKPWYKYPMVWFVISLPAIAVIASFATLIIAAKNAPVIIEQDQSYKAKINVSKQK